jgi:hypothetical protein
MMFKRAAVAAAALLWANGAPACGPGMVTVSFSPTSSSIASWNPFPNGTIQTTSITVTVTKNSGNNNVSLARLMILDGDTSTPLRIGSRSGFSGPVYTLTGGSASQSVSSSTPNAGNSIALDISGNGNRTANQTMTFTIPANDVQTDFTSGTYSQATSYFIQCYQQGNGTATGSGLTGTGPTLNVTVPPLLQVTTAGPQTINFGNFTTLNQQLQISMKSTGTINANVSTQYGNQMVLSGALSPYPTNSVIPYSMAFGGVPVPTGGGSLLGLSRTGVGGASKPLVLTMPSLPTGKLAGNYQDVITLTLSAGD